MSILPSACNSGTEFAHFYAGVTQRKRLFHRQRMYFAHSLKCWTRQHLWRGLHYFATPALAASSISGAALDGSWPAGHSSSLAALFWQLPPHPLPLHYRAFRQTFVHSVSHGCDHNQFDTSSPSIAGATAALPRCDSLVCLIPLSRRIATHALHWQHHNF